MMNILFFSLNFYPIIRSGMEKYLLNIVCKLRSRHKIVLFLPSKYNIHIAGVKICHFYSPQVSGTLSKYLHYIPSFISMIFQLPKILLKEKIEVISSFIPTEASVLVHLIGKLMGKKTIMNLRGVFVKENRFTLLTWDMTALFSEQIIVNSRDFPARYIEQSLLPAAYLKAKRWAYIPNAINVNLWQKSDLEKMYDIAFVANLQDQARIFNKGFDVLVKAIEISKIKYNRNLKVIVIGDYNLSLLRKVARYFDQNHFLFQGLIKNRAEIVKLLSQAKLFVLTSRTEGMPNSLMEAMALGMPCIATLVGAVGDLIENGKDGIICPPNSPEKIANSIDKLLLDEPLQAALAHAARLKMERQYSWEHSIKVIEAFYPKYKFSKKLIVK